MEGKELIADAFGRVEEALRLCLDGLTPEQLVYRPDEQANSIGWLAWHLTRVQDDHVSDLAGRPQAYIEDGWASRFGRAADPKDIGTGHTAEQVASLRPESSQLLLDYHRAVYQRTLAYLRTVTPASLDRELDEPRWNPRPTVGVRLVSVGADNTQHVGQIAYVRGLIERRHWYRA